MTDFKITHEFITNLGFELSETHECPFNGNCYYRSKTIEPNESQMMDEFEHCFFIKKDQHNVVTISKYSFGGVMGESFWAVLFHGQLNSEYDFLAIIRILKIPCKVLIKQSSPIEIGTNQDGDKFALTNDGCWKPI